MEDNNSGSIINKLLGKYPGRTLHRLGAALGGLWMSSLMINLIWPLPDQAVTNDSLVGIKMRRQNLPKMPINQASQKKKILMVMQKYCQAFL